MRSGLVHLRSDLQLDLVILVKSLPIQKLIILQIHSFELLIFQVMRVQICQTYFSLNFLFGINDDCLGLLLHYSHIDEIFNMYALLYLYLYFLHLIHNAYFAFRKVVFVHFWKSSIL